MLQSQNLEKEELIIEKETQNQNQPDQKEKENSNLNPKKINIIDDIEFEIQIDPELLINKTTELDDYICPLCKGLFLNPIIDHCRHSFCKDCFQKYYSIKHQCPITKQNLNSGDYISIDVLSKSIEKKEMKCKNYFKGCNWIGKISELNNHILNDCDLTEINCKCKDFGCEDKFKKGEFNLKMEKDCPKHLNLIADSLLDIKNNLNINNKKFKDFEMELEKKEKKIQELEENIREILSNKNNKIRNLSPFRKNNTITEIINLTNESNDDKILSKKREREREREREKEKEINEKSKNENVFDLTIINKSIIIKGNKAYYKSLFSENHVYLFGNPEYDIDINENKIRDWKIKLLDESKWIAFGLCDKNLVLSNNQIFCSLIKEKNFNNGCYLISSNGYCWNCNNKFENNKSINFPNFSEPFLLFSLSYNPISFELYFHFGNQLIKKLTNVKPFGNNKKLTPCIIFLDKDDEIELLINKD